MKIDIRKIIEYLDAIHCDDHKECEILGPGYCLAIKKLEALEKIVNDKK